MEEVRKAEKRLKNGKTGGDDGIVDELSLVNYGVEVVVIAGYLRF